MQNKQKSWSPLPNLFHRVTVNPKHTIISYACIFYLVYVYNILLMYLMCEEQIGFSTDRHNKSQAPSPHFTNTIVGV